MVVEEEVEHTSGLVKGGVFATETPSFYGAHGGSQLYLIQNQVFSGQCFYHELPRWALGLAWSVLQAQPRLHPRFLHHVGISLFHPQI